MLRLRKDNLIEQVRAVQHRYELERSASGWEPSMFVGHLAVAMGTKKVAPDVPLGAPVTAAFALDLIWPVLLLRHRARCCLLLHLLYESKRSNKKLLLSRETRQSRITRLAPRDSVRAL
jgi:hypothetical protein